MHAWSSLACTVFLLLACLTGLPLVFSDEIEAWQDDGLPAASVPAGTPEADVDALIAEALRRHPGEFVDFVVRDDEAPWVVVGMKPRAADPAGRTHRIRFDAHTGRVLKEFHPAAARRPGFMALVRAWHKDLFLGLAGGLFLGGIGLLFVLAVVSGVVLYGPFTKKLDFGTVRAGRSRRLRWLDLHNLLGIATVVWALVVGFTGFVNELSQPLFAVWRDGNVRTLLGSAHDGGAVPGPGERYPLRRAIADAERVLPGMRIGTVLMPGSRFGSPRHYLLWARGDTPITARLLTPVLVDARSGALMQAVAMPWYLRALELSRPLHFGDYGGLPLKAIWALLDLATIVVLGTGLCLWGARRKAAVARTAGVSARA